MKKIVIIAGEPSGDLYGGLLAEKLKSKFESLEIFSFGGPKLAEHSQQEINLLEHSVSGIIEVAGQLKEIFAVFHKALARIENIQPDLIIPIDFPDFNLRLVKKLNKKFPVFYYISPQVWAWRQKRVNLIRKFVEKMVVIFKFEQDFYKHRGIDALYFGHPLLEIIPKNNVEPKKIISFLPGSRKNEVKKHLPVMRETKKILKRELKEYTFRIIKPKNIEESFYAKFCPEMEIMNHSYLNIEESKFIVASSGTATVEIAILGVPYLIIYKINPLTWLILKGLVKTEFIGMVNILHSRKIVDEFLQNQATPQKIAERALEYLKNEKKYQELKHELQKTKDFLSPWGATASFADYIGDYLRLRKL